MDTTEPGHPTPDARARSVAWAGDGPVDPIAAKIVDEGALLRWREEARRDGRRVVHCHGCFDIVHPGHVRHLRFARSQGDALVVTITGDEGVAKGSGRPLIPQELRAENLAALDCVERVAIDRASTAVDLLERLRPDVYIKGREYESNHDPRFIAEREMVERHGGRVVFSSGDVVFSSSALIDAMSSAADPAHRRLRQLGEQPELERDDVQRLLGSMAGKRVVVAGEVRSEQYVFCDQPDIAEDAPTMSLTPLERRSFEGAAAAVARQAAALGAIVTLVAPCSEAEAAPDGESRLASLIGQVPGAGSIRLVAVRCEGERPARERFIVGTQRALTIEHSRRVVLDAARQQEFARTVGAAARGADAVIVLDAGHGLIGGEIGRTLTRQLSRRSGVLAIGALGRSSSPGLIRGADLLVAPEGVLRRADSQGSEALPAVVWRALDRCRCNSLVVGMGVDGLIGFSRLETPVGAAWATRVHGEPVPSLTPHPVDEVGCLEAALATSALAMSCGASLLAASVLAATVSGVEARRLGPTGTGPAELRVELQRALGAHLALRRPDVVARVDALELRVRGAG